MQLDLPCRRAFVRTFPKHREPVQKYITEMGHVGNMEFQNGKLKNLHLMQEGCCADPTTTLRIYSVTQEAD
jgi:hypothetical protein